MVKLLNKAKELQGNLGVIIALVTSCAFIWNTYIRDNPFIGYIKNQQIQGEALDAEMDLDRVVFKKYHLELYHSNKNSKGQFKFSYLKHKNRRYKAWVDPTSGFWVIRDGSKITYIKELSE